MSTTTPALTGASAHLTDLQERLHALGRVADLTQVQHQVDELQDAAAQPEL